jgi:hypothetical protein
MTLLLAMESYTYLCATKRLVRPNSKNDAIHHELVTPINSPIYRPH